MGRPGRKSINAVTREFRRMRIARLSFEGKTQEQIAVVVGVSRSQVAYDLRVLHERWMRAALEETERLKARELAKLDNLEREYWEAWHRSREAKTIETSGESEDADGMRTHASIRTETRDGNPAFLAGVERCIARRVKILGLTSPKRLSLVVEAMARELAVELGLPPEVRDQSIEELMRDVERHLADTRERWD